MITVQMAEIKTRPALCDLIPSEILKAELERLGGQLVSCNLNVTGCPDENQLLDKIC